MIKIDKKQIKEEYEIKEIVSSFDYTYFYNLNKIFLKKKYYIKKIKKISIILPIYGSFFKDQLKEVIKSWISIESPINKEIIISEQYEKEPIYKELAQSYNIKYISEPINKLPNKTFNPGRLRNMGRFIANGDLFYFSDADILPYYKNHLFKLVDLFSFSKNISLSRISFYKKEKSNKFQKYDFRLRNKNKKWILKYKPPKKAHGGTIIVPPHIFDLVGGYSEQFFNWGLEDSDLRWKISQIVPLIDLAKYKKLKVIHLEHKRPYLNNLIWERNVFYEALRRKYPIESLILSDILHNLSPYGKFLRESHGL